VAKIVETELPFTGWKI